MSRLCIIRIGLFVLISVFSLCPKMYADLRSPQNIIMSSEADSPTCAYAADLDGDGDLDILSNPKLAWYKNNGAGQFGSQQVLTTEGDGANSVYPADLDGDGDLDVLSANWFYGRIAWYENDGNGNFSSQKVINNESDRVQSIYAADLDSDGDLDVLSASSSSWSNDGKIAWYENDGSGQFGPQQVITSLANGAAASVFAADLDSDGDLDILSTPSYDMIAWYENDGSGQFGQQHVITTSSVDSFNSVYAMDLDGDGDLDLLSAFSGSWEVNYAGKIAWYENNGAGQFGPQQVIGTSEDSVNYVYAADLDGDGDMDVLSGEDRDDIAWYENNGYGQFGPQQEITNTADADAVASVYAADLDGDGDLDILAASSRDDKIAWYDNNGAGRFGSPQVITKNSVSGANSVYTADLDGDGDLDVLSSSYYDHKLAWYENDGAGWFGSQKVISNTSWHPQSASAADLDGDGDFDVLATSTGYDRTAWYENDGSGQFGPAQVITNNYTSSVSAVDLDGDGDQDVLSGSSADGTIAWYKNNGSGRFNSEHVIITEEGGVSSVYAADMDSDGDLDVLSASSLNWGQSNKIAWYENDGSGQFGSRSEHVITTPVNYVQSVYAADLDGDGDLDVISASKGSWEVDYVGNIVWYENDGSGQFGSQQVIYTAAWHTQLVYAADPDGDGNMDVLSASSFYNTGKIAWYENDGSGKFGSQQVISTEVDGANSVYAADLDGNGELDVLSTSSDHGLNDKIAWYKNYGSGQFDPQKVISTEVDGANSVYAADLDGDGDMDVLSGSYRDNKIAWYENDGWNQFGSQQVVSTEVDMAQSVYPADLDGDGDIDLLSASSPSYFDHKIAWYENDGSGQFGSQQVINTGVFYVRSIYAADLDSDGDQDVLWASSSSFNGESKIAWSKNEGSGRFDPEQVISNEVIGARSVYAADLDGDGDLDILSASVNDDKIAWYENDGNGNFSSQKVINNESDRVQSIYAADLDSDGDLDVLSASSSSWSNHGKIAWYKNYGSGQFDPQKVISTEVDGANSVYAADLDGDGDLDVLTTAHLGWYENDGSGRFGPLQKLTYKNTDVIFVYAADLDGDGDMDVLSASSNKIAWYENE